VVRWVARTHQVLAAAAVRIEASRATYDRYDAMETSGVVRPKPMRRLAAPSSQEAPPQPTDRARDIADDVEALARVLASEIGSGTYAEQMAIGWIARNLARTERTTASVARLVCAPCGESSGNARPFSTRQPATERTRQLAAMILASPGSDDPTHGATHCFEPGLQDRMHASGRAGYGLDARGVRYCWLRGLDYYGTVDRWDLFGPKNGKGARPVPAAWNLVGFSVCCSGDKRPGCRGKKIGDRVGG
jgi:hypothetical protein